LEGDDVTAEYVGIAKIEKSFVPTFVAQLVKMINEQKHSVWWENVLYELIQERHIYVKDVQGKFWAEVDFLEDYERILQFRNYWMDLDGNVHKRKSAS
jgi:choline kinase